MTSFHQFSILAASRNEGLHPKLRDLLERAAASPFSEVSMRKDGLIQAGPSPASEAFSSRANVTPLSRYPACPAVASPKPEKHSLPVSSLKLDLVAMSLMVQLHICMTFLFFASADDHTSTRGIC